jgi:hypothetical protein
MSHWQWGDLGLANGKRLIMNFLERHPKRRIFKIWKGSKHRPEEPFGPGRAKNRERWPNVREHGMANGIKEKRQKIREMIRMIMGKE